MPLAGQGEAFFGAGVAHAQAVAQPGLGGRIAPSLGLASRIDDADQARQSRLLEVDRGGEGLGQLQAFRSGFGCGTVGEFGGDLRQQRHQFTGGRLFNPKICRTHARMLSHPRPRLRPEKPEHRIDYCHLTASPKSRLNNECLNCGLCGDGTAQPAVDLMVKEQVDAEDAVKTL